MINKLKEARKHMLVTLLNGEQEERYYCSAFTKAKKPILTKNSLFLTNDPNSSLNKFRKLLIKKQSLEKNFRNKAKLMYADILAMNHPNNPHELKKQSELRYIGANAFAENLLEDLPNLIKQKRQKMKIMRIVKRNMIYKKEKKKKHFSLKSLKHLLLLLLLLTASVQK